MFDNLRDKLLLNLDPAHDAYYKAETFGGPSLYFHQQALLVAEQGDFAAFAEKVYAVLSAWGMHRMGRGGSKMRDFTIFQQSLQPLWPTILELQKASPDQLDEVAWRSIRRVFWEIRCMASATSLVGNSKVMAHAIPNLIPPIDREYTLRFLFGRTDIRNGLDGEWLKLQTILREFFYPLLQAKSFRLRSADWMRNKEKFKWDTSSLKIVDNLIIGFMKLGPATEGVYAVTNDGLNQQKGTANESI